MGKASWLDDGSWAARHGRAVTLAVSAGAAVVFSVCLMFAHFDRYATPPQDATLGTLLCYWVPFLLCWVALSGLAWTLTSTRFERLTLSRSQTLAVIVGIAALVRIVTILGTTPTLSDDIWRYIHDGHMVRAGHNPYVYTPGELLEHPQAAPIALESSHLEVLRRTNNPKLVSIYLPTSQWTFSLLATVHNTFGGWRGWLDPLGDRTFRLGFALFDLIIIALLMAQLIEKNRSPWWAVLYAWHPLAISEVALGGHQDVVGIALLLISLHVVERAGLSVWHAIFSGFTLGASAVVKPIVLPVIAPMTMGLRRSPYHAMYLTLITAITAIATFLPFVYKPGGLAGLRETLQAFTERWAFNASAFGLLRFMFEVDPYWLRLGAGCVIAVTMGIGLLRGMDRYTFAGWVFVVSALVSSTVHPWYLLWALAMLPVSRFNAVTWVLSLTITLSYAALLDMSVYQPPWWLVTVEYLPVYAVLAWACWRGIRNK